MPITWRVESDGRYVVFAVSDPYTMDEWRGAASAVLTAPLADRYIPILVDRRRTEPLTTRAVDDIIRFASEHGQLLAGRRVSILVDHDANFGMGRMTELRAAVAIPNTAIRTFRTYEDAFAWLTGDVW
jgi:hypothetical protein